MRLSAALLAVLAAAASTTTTTVSAKSPSPLLFGVPRAGSTATISTDGDSNVSGSGNGNNIIDIDESAGDSLAQQGTLKRNKDEPLTKDINMLSDVLSDLVLQDDPNVHDLYEEFKTYGKIR